MKVPIGKNLLSLELECFDFSRMESSVQAKIGSTWKTLRKRLDSSDSDFNVGFYDAPISRTISQIEESRTLAEKFQNESDHYLWLGIGGSSLGPMSVLSALGGRKMNARFHFLENPDPDDWQDLKRTLDPTNTRIIAVTKSGGTFETMAQFLCALEWLGADRWKKQTIGITDPKKGGLREFCSRSQIPSLNIHPTIGGRFSIFSPVGLFPLALAGFNTEAFLEGASKVRQFFEGTPPEENPALHLCTQLVEHFDRCPIHTIMPYSTKLRLFSLWWVQLWGESLGKEQKGFTPLAAVGATDQHSLLQLLRDGPPDKVVNFLKVRNSPHPTDIPSPKIPEASGIEAFELLKGHTLQHLLHTELEATNKVLTGRGLDCWTITLEQLDERSLGALYFFFSVMTAFTGSYWDIDPFDQPGVEEGKIYTRQALQRSTSSRTPIRLPHSNT